METKRQRRQRFLVEHPTCCFCGGIAASVEPDHVPARAFFRDRQWPEGYEFPACVACNRATRKEEQAVAMLARIYPDGATDAERKATVKLMGEVNCNHPGLFEEMQPSPKQLETAATKYGLTPPPGATVTSLPVFSVAGPLVNEAVAQFSRKLFCALFYKHAEQVLGASGGIAFRWFSNIQVNADEIDRAIATVTPYAPRLERNSATLTDQFFYRWGVTDTKRMGAFLAFFGQSFAILGVVTQAPSSMPELKNGRMLRPFDHAPAR